MSAVIENVTASAASTTAMYADKIAARKYSVVGSIDVVPTYRQLDKAFTQNHAFAAQNLNLLRASSMVMAAQFHLALVGILRHSMKKCGVVERLSNVFVKACR